jgi:pimeloyl-ACP methyl ester carboxylesterase
MKRSHAAPLAALTLLVLLCGPGLTARAQQGAPPPPGSFRPLYADAAPVRTPESLSSVALPNTTIDSVTIDPMDGSCRVTATVTHPPARDRIQVFIALPVKGWNGRFMGTGGGGFSGGSPRSLAARVAQGFAAGATDTGHEGGRASFALDAKGRLNWPGIRANAYLGIHDMTGVGKALCSAFYGKPPRHSYFVGTSTGGRQGLSEAQRYPEDYDGIISLAPAINWSRFLACDLWPQLVMLEARNFVPIARLRAATEASVRACDEKDGVKDGIVDDPLTCDYDPAALVGTPIEGSPFTAADAEVVRKIWDGPRTRKGEFIWYGLTRGTNLAPLAATEGSPLRGVPFGVTMDYLRFYLKQEPDWDWTTLTRAEFEQLQQQSIEQYTDVLGTDNPDLTRFRDRGGKLLLAHGLIDELIPVQGSIAYYDRVVRQMGGLKATQQFARFFLLPGVSHGMQGPGPAPTPTRLVETIVSWVEEGSAPDRLTGEQRDPSGKVIRTRPLFPYPLAAKYGGRGNPDDAASYRATLPAGAEGKR